MKFSAAFTSLVLLVPLFAGEALGAAAVGRDFFHFHRGKHGNGRNQGNGAAANNGTAANTSAAAASTAVANTTAVANNATAAANNATVLASTGNNNNNGSSSDPQSSLTLDPAVIATGFEQNGQATPVAGQVASLTSSNNFINFCLTVPNLPITNGQQIKTGSCNPNPMGIIAANTNMPSAKFVTPVNGQDIAPNTAFTISMAVNHLQTGNFVNAQTNYYAAPQQVNAQGDIVGHTHFTVQSIPSFTSTTPLDSSVFAFFKGVNGAAVNGVVSETVANGLPAGVYRVCSINTDANHAPCLVAVAQHGSLDDCVYFSVGGAGGASPFGGNAAANTTAAASNATAAAPPAAAANSTAAASSAAPAASSAASAASSAAASAASSAAPAASSAAAAGNGGNQNGNGGNQNGNGGNQNGNGGNKGKGRKGGRDVRRMSRLGRDY